MVMSGIKRKFCQPVRKKRAIAPNLAGLLLLKLRSGRLETLSIMELRNAALFNILYFATAHFEEVQALETENIRISP